MAEICTKTVHRKNEIYFAELLTSANIRLAGCERGACDAAKHKPRACVRLGLVLFRRVDSPSCNASTSPFYRLLLASVGYPLG